MKPLKSVKGPFFAKKKEDLSKYIPSGKTLRQQEQESDLKQQIEKLIENARVALIEYESQTKKDKQAYQTINDSTYQTIPTPNPIPIHNSIPTLNSANYASQAGQENPGYNNQLNDQLHEDRAEQQTQQNNNQISQNNDQLPQGNGQILLKPALTPALTQSQNQEADNVRDGTRRKLSSRIPIEEVIAYAAAGIAKDIGAGCVISIERKEKQDSPIKEDQKEHFTVNVSIFKRVRNGYERVEYQTKMRRVTSGSIVPVKELLIEAINKKYIRKGDRVVCVEDESLGMGYKALLLIFDVDKIFFNISTLHLAQHVSPEIIESAINIGIELGKEGREGRKVGTAFIIGNADELKKHMTQMIMNPFSGYPEEIRNITDQNIKETVKNFAQLDGIFIIDEKGTIVTAGAYIINTDITAVDLPQGYGTRHRCSAAITKICDCIAIVVSESGGIVSVFKDGKLVMRLP